MADDTPSDPPDVPPGDQPAPGDPDDDPVPIPFLDPVRDQTYSLGVVLDVSLPQAESDTGAVYSLEPDVPGLSFDPRTRVLSGTPTTVGVYPMTYTARVDGDTVTMRFNINVVEIGQTMEAATEITQGFPIRGRFTTEDEAHYFKVEVSTVADLHAATDRVRIHDLTIVSIDPDEPNGLDGQADHLDSLENAQPGTYYITVRRNPDYWVRDFDYTVAVWVLTTSENDTLDIEVRYVGKQRPDAAGRHFFQKAVEYWESALRESPSTRGYMVTSSAMGCDWGYPTFGDYVDDFVLHLYFKDLDENTYAYARHCDLRPAPSNLPYRGEVVWGDDKRFGKHTYMTMIHEIAHALGFSQSVWAQGPYYDTGSSDPHFSGPKAIAAFNEAGGESYQGAKVPTEGGHWRRSVIIGEVMAWPYHNGSPSAISKITLALFDDLGYDVNYAAAQPYRLPPFASTVEAGAGGYKHYIGDRSPGQHGDARVVR